MADRIVVEFDGDAKGLVSTTTQATKSLTDLDKTGGRALNNFDKSLQGVGNAATKTGAQIKASNTNYLNFGRVIQDLPFGFTGIQNNLTQLIPAVGALGLGFSVLISALTFLQVGTSYWTRGLKDNGDAVSRNIDLARQFNTELVNGRAQGMAEISMLQSYLAIAKDETVTRKGRLQAIKAINDIMPDILGDIQLEGVYSEETTRKIDKYTKAVFLNAKVKAASSLIEKEYTKQFEAQAKSVEDNATGLQKTGAVIGAAIVGIGAEIDKVLNPNLQTFNLTTGVEGARKAVEVYNSSVKRIGKTELEKTIKGSEIAISSFTKILNDSNKELAQMGLLFTDVDKSGKKLKSLAEILKELNTDLKVNSQNQDATDKYEKVALDLNSYQKAITSLIQNGFKPEGKEVDDLKSKYEALFDTIDNRGKGITNNNLTKFDFGISSLDDTKDGVITKGKLTIKDAKVDFTNADTTISGAKIDFKPLLANFVSDFNRSLSTLNQGSFNVLRNIVFNFGDLLNNQIQNVFANQLQKTLDDFADGLAITTKQLVAGIAGLAGNALKGLTNPTSKVGQGLGGALTGAAVGSSFGLIGGVIGGVVGLLGGVLGAGKAKKQQELQEKQLAEAEKQTKLLEQSNALAYTSSIIGRMTNQGTVTGFEINSTGNLVAKLQGKDFLIMFDRAVDAKKRGR